MFALGGNSVVVRSPLEVGDSISGGGECRALGYVTQHWGDRWSRALVLSYKFRALNDKRRQI